MPAVIIKSGIVPFDILFYDLPEEVEVIKQDDAKSWMMKFFLSGCFCFHITNEDLEKEFKMIYLDKALCSSLSEAEKFALIQHEAGHLVNRDILKAKPVDGLVTSRQIEIDADLYALKAGAKPLALATGILKTTLHCLSHRTKVDAVYVGAVYVIPEMASRFASIAKFWLKKILTTRRIKNE